MQRLNPLFVRTLTLVLFLLLGACAATRPQPGADPLPSWNEGAVKQSIVGFLSDVTDPSGGDFIAVPDRIAVFDNDGTLWSEKPTYFQFLFVLDRVRALAPDHPEWETQQPFQAVLENDPEALAAAGEQGLLELIKATSSGMTTDEFGAAVSDWMASARHPVRGLPFTAMVFQPMLELMDLLRENGFSVYIVSGGGTGFMRPWVEEVYGVPPQNVVGSGPELRYELREEGPVIVREAALHFVNDKATKPVGIERAIGRRPVFAAGNSDGDYEMLEWTTRGTGRRLGLIVHHTDAAREWAYDRASNEGRLDRALDAATVQGWTVIDMARDWRLVFPPDR